MSTITQEQQAKIADFLKGKHIPRGLGNNNEACSIAAINLALSGKLSDEIPNCMSRVIGRWIIRIQDAMPDDMRNSEEWRALLPLAAGTGREHEKERKDIIMKWMWETVLPYHQPLADKNGYGEAWKDMCNLRTAEAARIARAAYAANAAANAAAYAAYAYAAAAAAYAAYAYAYAYAAAAAAYAAYAYAYAAAAAAAADAAAAAAAADAAAAAAAAAADAADAAADAAWKHFDPANLLAQLIEVSK